MDLLQTLLVYMSLVFASSVQTAPEPSIIPETPDYSSAYTQSVPVPTAAPTPVPTIDITPNPSYSTLKIGDRGGEVRKLQEALKEHGYLKGDVDGAYGNQTRMAVEQFQYMHGLTADGIAGRHTLTVLYESNQIRPADGLAVTPAPTAETQLTIAITPTPTPEVTATPVVTAAPTVYTAPQPTPEPLVLEEMAGYTLLVNRTAFEGRAYRNEDTVYLPILEVLKASGVYVISSTSLEMDEYAFASGLNFVRFTHTENQAGDPVELQIYFNDEALDVSNRTLYRSGDVLYIPEEGVRLITGMEIETDEVLKEIRIAPKAE